jgi:hypothetical protein
MDLRPNAKLNGTFAVMELLGRREPCDRDDLKTAGPLWIKSL